MGNLKFITEVEVPKWDSTINYSSKIMLIGSCFSTEIGNLLKDYRFNVLVNPFGTIYNPCSIACSIERLITGEPFTEDEVIQTNPTDAAGIKRYASFWHHSSFARSNVSDFLENANINLANACQFLKHTDTIIITLGTAWIYTLAESGTIVSNCHKRVAKEFERRLLGIDECYRILSEIAHFLPDKKIIFTISPIRHLKDGAHGNQISKSTLMMAVEQTVAKNNNCYYFPSYEIMMDELRDYRYYAEDLVHPSPLAVKYIFDKFKESYISPLEFKQMECNIRLTKAEKHIQKQIL